MTAPLPPQDMTAPSVFKVLIVMPLAEQRGGAELALLDLLRDADRATVTWVVVFLQEGPMVQQVREMGIEAHVVPAGRLRQPHRMVRAVFRIASIARQAKVDAVLSWMGKPHLYASPAALLARRTPVWFQHATPSRARLLDWIIHLLPAKAILACSHEVEQAERAFWPRRRTRVVFPGVDLNRFDPAKLPSMHEARRQCGLPEHGPLIGIVGRLQRWKGIHVLIQAMPAVLQRYPDAHCVVVGGEHELEPDYAAYLRDQITTLGLSEQVILAGLQKNVPVWMQAADVMVHASDREPFGIVVLEAMALGKPVVAGDQGGPRTIITPDRNGLLAPYGDSAAIAAAICRYLAEPSLASSVGQAARQRALEFSTSRYANHVVAAVREVSRFNIGR